MLNRLRTVANQVVETVRSVAGIRAGIEEPLYIVEPLIDDVEIRQYGLRIAAQTTLLAGEEDARYAGFHRLAGYIFGSPTTGARRSR